MILLVVSVSWYFENSKLLVILTIVYIQNQDSPKLQTRSPEKKWQSNCWYFEVVLGGQAINCVPVFESWPEMPELFVILAQFDVGTRVSLNQLARFLPSRSQLFLLVLKFSVRTHCFSPCIGMLIGQKCRKMLLVLACQDLQTHFLQLYLPCFSIKVSIDTLLLDAEYWLENIMKNIIRGEASAHWPKMAKVLLLGYLDIPTRLSGDLQIWIFVSISESILIFFRCFLQGTISDCVPSIGILMVAKCRRVHLTFIFRRSQSS